MVAMYALKLIRPKSSAVGNVISQFSRYSSFGATHNIYLMLQFLLVVVLLAVMTVVVVVVVAVGYFTFYLTLDITAPKTNADTLIWHILQECSTEISPRNIPQEYPL